MSAHFSLAEPFAQLVRHTLDQAPGIDEHQTGSVRLYLRHELIVHRTPNILSNDRAQLGVRHFYAELHIPFVADIDNGTLRRPIGGYRMVPDQQTADFFDGFLRGTQSDPL